MSNRNLYEPNRDEHSPNRNLAPIETEVDNREGLFVGGCGVNDLAARYGTPLYILDEKTIRTACRSYIKSLQKYYPGPALPLYASKANSSLVLTRLVASEGLGLDVVSQGELITGINGGMDTSKIFLHGNNKSKSELELAYQNGVTIVIDNQYDIDRISEIASKGSKPANLMLRFTPGIECHTHEYIKTGHLDSKFGFDPDEVEAVLNQLKGQEWLSLNGLHAHIGSQIFELQPHKDLVDVMANLLKSARDKGHPVNDINVGGGLGIRYIDSDDPPSISTWVKEISLALEKACISRNLNLPRLICEPGRSLIASSGITIYRIGARKVIPGIRTYISVDGGMSDNPRPITYQSLYKSCLVNRPANISEEVVTIAGKHCESGDVLLKDVSLPSSKSGDLLAIFATGAYNSSMSSNYNRIPRPAAVIVNEGHSDLIQRREQPEDLLQYDVVPDRFLELS